MLYLQKIIIVILICPIIYSYIIFPLLKEDYNFSSSNTPQEIIRKLIDSGLYTTIKIGSPSVDVKAYLDSIRTELMIGGDGVKGVKYNESKSTTYNCNYCKIKEYSNGWYSEGILSTEDFIITNDKKISTTVHNLNFVVAKQCVYTTPPQGTFGLQLGGLSGYEEYNLINNLKSSRNINTSDWFLSIDSIGSGDNKIIIGSFPHDINSKKYHSEKYKTVNTIALNNLKGNLIWGLRFSNIIYNDINLNLSSEQEKIGKIEFDLGIVVAPQVFQNFFIEQFFGQYMKKNICFNNTYGKVNFMYCQKNSQFKKENFKTLYFNNFELNVIFELNYEDLFFEKNDYIYFMIVFKETTSWSFGELFLKKYHLTFNQEAKTIGYYEDPPKPIKKPDNFKFYLIIIILSIVLIASISVGVYLYIKTGKKKSRANELNDDFEYESSINNQENNIESILSQD